MSINVLVRILRNKHLKNTECLKNVYTLYYATYQGAKWTDITSLLCYL